MLARIERYNPAINAVVAMDPVQARERARRADNADRPWGPLHGLPVTVKDCFEVTGMPATGGSERYARHLPATNAPAVRRLIEAGAIIIGKTNLPERASHHTANDLYGVTRNPWNTCRSPGGSSGGSAAAVAAGFSFLDLATDNGGSIRGPAHHCGVYGHKPSFGLISTLGQVHQASTPFANEDITVSGPIARSADDLALATNVLSKPDSFNRAAHSLELPRPRHCGARGWRVAAWLDDPCCPVDSAVGDCLDRAIECLSAAGITVDVAARPRFEPAKAFDTYLSLIMAVVSRNENESDVAAMGQMLSSGEIDPYSYHGRYARGVTMRHAEWITHNNDRVLLRQIWREFFQDYDVLLTPAMPTTALPHDHDAPYFSRTITVNGKSVAYWDQLFWAGLFGVAYLPSTVAPIGLAANGLPVGMQIVGPHREDHTSIAFARLMADVCQGFSPPPQFA